MNSSNHTKDMKKQQQQKNNIEENNNEKGKNENGLRKGRKLIKCTQETLTHATCK